MDKITTEKSAEDKLYESSGYRRSRGAYMAQCAFEYLVSLLVADAYLAKLLTNIGLDDALIGIISSFVIGTFMFQLATVFLVDKIKKTKRTAIIFSTLSQILFSGLFLIPFIPGSVKMRTVLVIAGLLVAYFCCYFMTSVIFKWGNSFVHPDRRATYSAIKEIVSLISGMVFTIIVGFIVDKFEAIGNIRGAFIFIAASGLILAICNFVSLVLISKQEKIEQKKSSSPWKAIKNIVRNRSYMNVVILTAIWNSALYLTVGFLGTYKIKELAYTVGTVQLINIAGNLCRAVASRPFGRYSDRTSFAKGIELAMWAAAASFLCNVFTTPDMRFMIIVYTVLYNVSMAGTNANLYNIIYNFVPEEYFVHATALKNCVGGIFTFLASLVGSTILSAVQKNGNTFFGIKMYGQQVLSAISFVMIVCAILFTKFVIEKQKAMRQ